MRKVLASLLITALAAVCADDSKWSIPDQEKFLKTARVVEISDAGKGYTKSQKAMLDDGKRNLLFVGRLEKRKGAKYLLRAFVGIHARHPNTRLIVVGEGGLRKGYERAMKAAGVEDVVFAGFVPEAELPRYYASADICCSPATGHESFGIVLLEAMASGKPVVASNIDGYAQVLTHGVEGLLVRPKDPDAIAQAVEQLLNSPETRMAMGEKGRLRAQEFSWERVAQRVLSYYERLLYERAEMQRLAAAEAEA